MKNSTPLLLPITLAATVTVGGLLAPPAGAKPPAMPPAPPAIVAEAAAPAADAALQRSAWLAATPAQRVNIAEAIGEAGARGWAANNGWTDAMNGAPKTYRQGFDQVYRSTDSLVQVVEAKGGTSALKFGYGHPQGSPEWAVEGAARVLRSPQAGAAEKAAARLALDAAAEGRLTVSVVRTPHVLGVPGAPAVESVARSTPEATTAAARLLAEAAERAAAARAATAASERAPIAAERAVAATAERTVAQTVGVVATRTALLGGAVVDVGLRASDASDVERRFDAGEVTAQEREVAHARNAAGAAGGWAGAFYGGQAGAAAGTYAGAAASAVFPPAAPLLVPAGAVVGTIGGATAGYVAGDAVAAEVGGAGASLFHRTGYTALGWADYGVDAFDRYAGALTIGPPRTPLRATLRGVGTAAVWTGETAVSVGSTVGSAVGVAAEWTADTASSAASAVRNGAGVAWDGTKSATAATGRAIGSGCGWTAGQAASLWHRVAD